MIGKTLEEVEASLENLITYIKFIKNNNIFLETISSSDYKSAELRYVSCLKNKLNNKRVIEYNSFIITLYGFFENFIENLIEEYLELLEKQITSYQNLPEAIKSKNIELTNQLIIDISRKNRYSNLSQETIIKKLHESVNNDCSSLNICAFQTHTSNFRFDTIKSQMENIGVGGLNNKLKRCPEMKKFLEVDFGNHLSGLNSKIAFAKINKLADLRNEVAHGHKIDEILSYNSIIEYTEFIILFCRSISNVLADSACELLFNITNKNIKIIKVFKKNILCASVNSINITKNTQILVKRETNCSPQYTYRKINGFEIDGVSVEKITAKGSLDIGIELNGNITDQNDFRLFEVNSTP